MGDFEHALEAAAATLPAWSALYDPQSQTDAYAKLGLAYMAAGEYDAAATALEHAVALGRKLNNSKTIANNLVLLAQLAALRHDAAGASKAYQRALTAAREGGYRRDESLALSGLGDLAIASGNPHGAVSLLREALAIARDTGQAYDQANLRRQLGEAAAALGKPPKRCRSSKPR